MDGSELYLLLGSPVEVKFKPKKPRRLYVEDKIIEKLEKELEKTVKKRVGMFNFTIPFLLFQSVSFH
jgi:hypothetical protein